MIRYIPTVYHPGFSYVNLQLDSWDLQAAYIHGIISINSNMVQVGLPA